MKKFRDNNEHLRDELDDINKDVDAVLERVAEIVEGLDDLDYDVEQVGILVDDALEQYERIKLLGYGKVQFITEDATQEDGKFAQFMTMLENSIVYERNLRTCGTPDCQKTCMQEPLLNED